MGTRVADLDSHITLHTSVKVQGSKLWVKNMNYGTCHLFTPISRVCMLEQEWYTKIAIGRNETDEMEAYTLLIQMILFTCS